jgi:hypothetical protein
MVSDPFAVLDVGYTGFKLPLMQYPADLPLCSFLPSESHKWAFRRVPATYQYFPQRGFLKGKTTHLAATHCAFPQKFHMDAVIQAFQTLRPELNATFRLFALGTSRVFRIVNTLAMTLMNQPHFEMPGNPPGKPKLRHCGRANTSYPTFSEFRYCSFTPPESSKIPQILEEVNFCGDPSNLDVLFVSDGIHALRYAKYSDSPHSFVNHTRKTMHTLLHKLKRRCPSRDAFRIIWADQLATHAIQPGQEPRSQDVPDVVAKNCELAATTPFVLHQSRQVFQAIAKKHGDAFLPVLEASVQLRSGQVDCFHSTNTGDVNQPLATMLLMALEEVFRLGPRVTDFLY